MSGSCILCRNVASMLRRYTTVLQSLDIKGLFVVQLKAVESNSVRCDGRWSRSGSTSATSFKMDLVGCLSRSMYRTIPEFSTTAVPSSLSNRRASRTFPRLIRVLKRFASLVSSFCLRDCVQRNCICMAAPSATSSDMSPLCHAFILSTHRRWSFALEVRLGPLPWRFDWVL